MTAKEAFRLGFLARLAERGVSVQQFEKKAVLGLEEFVNSAGKLVDSATPLALATVVGIPATMGLLTGWAHAGVDDVTEEDIDRIKQQDFIDTYRSEARRIRRKLGRNSWRKAPLSPAADF